MGAAGLGNLLEDTPPALGFDIFVLWAGVDLEGHWVAAPEP